MRIAGDLARLRAFGAALLALFLLFFPARPAGAAGGAPPAGTEATVAGKATLDGEGQEGARVYAYHTFDDLLRHRPAARSEPTDGDGAFLLELPAGSYYLVAKKGEGEGDGPVPTGGYFSFHGSNPFTLAAGPNPEVGFPMVPRRTSPAFRDAEDAASGSLEGVVTYRGEVLEGARVKLYLDAGSDFRGMGYAVSPPTDASGGFRFDYLPESSYYLVAHRRAGGGGGGPLAEGDYYGYFVDNPVRVVSGKVVEVSFEVVSKVRDAAGAGRWARPSGTRIAGRVTSPDGSVVPGVYAFAYLDKVMSHKKPDFISRQIDGEGNYVLHLSAGGTYYIGARSAYGDSPSRGEWYGRYDGSADHSVRVGEGQTLKGVDIVVERILP